MLVGGRQRFEQDAAGSLRRPSDRIQVRLMAGKDTLRSFGPAGREVAMVGQGSWRAEEAHGATAIAALRRGLDLGMTHLDTAEMYGSGAAEALVGKAIEGRRDEVFL